MGILTTSPRFAATGGGGLPVAGAILWWDFSDEATVTIDTGISEVTDKTGNGNAGVQITGLRQPVHATSASIGGGTLKVAQFDGSADVLATASSIGNMPFTWFVTCVKPDSVGTDVLVRVDQHATYIDASSRLTTWTGTTGNVWTTTTTDWTDDHVYCLKAQTGAGSTQLYIDGTATGSAATFTNTGDEAVFMGADNASGTSPGNWYVGEFILYPSALNDTDRNAVEDYLSAKWGTP